MRLTYEEGTGILVEGTTLDVVSGWLDTGQSGVFRNGPLVTILIRVDRVVEWEALKYHKGESVSSEGIVYEAIVATTGELAPAEEPASWRVVGPLEEQVCTLPEGFRPSATVTSEQGVIGVEADGKVTAAGTEPRGEMQYRAAGT